LLSSFNDFRCKITKNFVIAKRKFPNCAEETPKKVLFLPNTVVILASFATVMQAERIKNRENTQ